MRRIFILLLISALISSITAIAEEDIEEQIRKALPELLGANNFGTDFWISNPPAYEESDGNNFVQLYISSPFKTEVKVEVKGKKFSVTKETIPNDVIVFDLPPDTGQVKSKGVYEKPFPEKVYEDYGVHISAGQPVSVYCISRFKSTSDGYLAMPVSALGIEYIVSTYEEDPMFKRVWNNQFPSTSCIVAPYDDTEVSFTLGGNETTRTAGGMNPGETKSVTLNKGDVWMFMADGENADLSGSRIVSSKPVAVISGNQCANIPVENQWCDYIVEMQLPVNLWGIDYHVRQVPERKNASIIRVFASDDNTKIYRNGEEIAMIPKSGGVKNEGFIEMRLSEPEEDEKPEAAVISGNKPIGVMLFNTGVEEDGYPLVDSDPFAELQVPVDLYTKDIIFCVPGTFGGDVFIKNYIDLIYECDDEGNAPDHMQIAKVENGNVPWIKLNEEYPGRGDLFKYDIYGKKYALKTLRLDTVGVYKIKSETPFAAYSYGYGWCDSYGYPTAGLYLDSDNDKDSKFPELVVSDKEEDNSHLQGKIEDSGSGISLAFLFEEYSSNYEFKCEPSATSHLVYNWELNILNKYQDGVATIVYADQSGNYTYKTFEYEGEDAGSVTVEEAGNRVKLYPSPVTGISQIELNLDGIRKATVKVMDIHGNAVLTIAESLQISGNDVFQLNAAELSSGTYILHIRTDDRILTKKFSVIK